jgi:hypothetical protein
MSSWSIRVAFERELDGCEGERRSQDAPRDGASRSGEAAAPCSPVAQTGAATAPMLDENRCSTFC